MINRDRISLEGIARYAGLYFILVAYSGVYEYFYKYLLTPIVHDMFTAYAPARAGIYTAIEFLTPLAILPIGTKLRTPGQFITGTLAVILFIPIPIVFVPMASIGDYWAIYSALWTGFLIVCTLSSLDIETRLPQLNDQAYKQLLTVIFFVIGVGLLLVVATNRVKLVSLREAHAARAGVTVTGLQAYLIPGYVSSYGGLLVAVAVVYRRYFLTLLALAGFLISYVSIEERTAAIMPLWIAYIYFAQRFAFKDSVIRYFMCVMAPFLLLVCSAKVIGISHPGSAFHYLFTLATYRVYSVPAIGFNVYYNFFHFNPHTYWSHISLISKFVNSPYNGQQIPHIMAEAYRLGSYNASFLETDGLAAAGVSALPWICALFGVVLVALNSCMRRLDVKVLALVTAGSSIALIDTGMGPGLLTNGLAILAVILSVAPRRPPWVTQG